MHLIRSRVRALSQEERARYELAADLFDDAWQAAAQTPPDINTFLVSEEPVRTLLLVALLKTDIEARRDRCLPLPIEDYCTGFPELTTDSTALVDVIEWQHRIEKDKGVDADVYCQRFPQIAEMLRAVLWRRDKDWPDQVGPYQIDAEIARGGMGVVLKAQDAKFNRILAVKLLACGSMFDQDSCARFMEESRITAQLQHPGVPPIHDCGVLADGRPYFTMKLIQGRTLAGLLDARKTASEDRPKFLGVFAQICQTLAYAHTNGIIHRDLKPVNVMVGAFGEVQVMDWGLAKHVDDCCVSAPRTLCNRNSGIDGSVASSSVRTGTGDILGTPAYVAPEQARGEFLEFPLRVDVFGIGSILCEILTGSPPFSASAPRGALGQAQSGDLSIAFASLKNCGADSDLIQLAVRCLDPDPRNRPKDATEVSEEISRYLKGLEERLQNAEVERTAAIVRVDEAQKRRELEVREGRRRRRILVPSAIALLVFLIAVTYLLAQLIVTQEWGEKHVELSAKNEQLYQEADRQRLVAEKLHAEADKQRREAEKQRARSRRFEYAAELHRAQGLHEKGDTAGALEVLHRLAPTDPSDDLRRLEWFLLKQRYERSDLIIKGHTHSIRDVAFHPHKRILASAGSDRTIRLWDLTTLNPIRNLVGFTGDVTCVRYSPDGTLIASGSSRGEVKVWKSEEDRPLYSHTDHVAGVTDIAFSPDGAMLVSGSKDGKMIFLESLSGKQKMLLKDQGDIRGLAFNKSGTQLAWVAGTRTKTNLSFYDFKTATVRAPIVNVPDASQVLFGPDEKSLALAGKTPVVTVLEASSGKQILTIRGDERRVIAIAYSRDGKTLATGGENGVVKLWNAGDGTELRALSGHTAGVWSLAFSPDSNRLVSAGRDTTIRLWNLGSNSEGRILSKHGAPVSGVAWTPDGKWLVSTSHDRTALVVNVANPDDKVQLKGHASAVYSVAVSQNGKWIATGGHDHFVKIWDVDTRALIRSLVEHKKPVSCVTFDSENTLLGSVSQDGEIVIWDVQSWRPRVRYQHTQSQEPFRGILAIAFRSQGEQFATAGHDGIARLWDVTSKKPTCQFLGHVGPIQTLAFSRTKGHLATAGLDRTVKFWDIETQKEAFTLRGHTNAIRSISVSADGDRLATSGDDRTISIWDTDTGQPLLKWSESDEGILGLAFSPDSRSLAIASKDGYAKVFEVIP